MRTPSEQGIEVGAFRIARVGSMITVEGETPNGVTSQGRGRLYEVTDADECRLTVRDTTWANGERDVVAAERHDSPQRFDTLVERLRLPVMERGDDLYVELRQVRLKPNGRGNLFSASDAELDAGAGVRVAQALERHGAHEIGTRAELLDDRGPTRGRLGVRFPRKAEAVPLVAYVCTRVAPVARALRA